jgi:hypothetical protein
LIHNHWGACPAAAARCKAITPGDVMGFGLAMAALDLSWAVEQSNKVLEKMPTENTGHIIYDII